MDRIRAPVRDPWVVTSGERSDGQQVYHAIPVKAVVSVFVLNTNSLLVDLVRPVASAVVWRVPSPRCRTRASIRGVPVGECQRARVSVPRVRDVKGSLTATRPLPLCPRTSVCRPTRSRARRQHVDDSVVPATPRDRRRRRRGHGSEDGNKVQGPAVSSLGPYRGRVRDGHRGRRTARPSRSRK